MTRKKYVTQNKLKATPSYNAAIDTYNRAVKARYQ